MTLKAYVLTDAQNAGYDWDENPAVVVFATSHREARHHWRWVNNIERYIDVRAKRAPDADCYADEPGYSRCARSSIVERAAGLRDDNRTCDTCGLGQFHDLTESRVCEDCGQCGECGCMCEQREEASDG